MLVLGSTSPRRAELLNQLRLDFEILRPNIDESPRQRETPKEYVSRMSNEKFHALQVGHNLAGGSVLLTADTVVVQSDRILGKPNSEAEGIEMLSNLSGEQHLVLTSVTIGTSQQYNRQFVVETKVQFRRLTMKEVEAYWRTGEPEDKAGAYGIQGIGAVLVDWIEGSYSNVVGLPLTETAQILAEFEITTLG